MVTISHEPTQRPGGVVEGKEARARRVGAEDVDGLIDLHQRLSAETLRSVYLTARPDLPRDRIARLVGADGRKTVGHVAHTRDRIVGFARYEWDGSGDAADATVLVDDAEQGNGIEALLVDRLAADARRNGLRHLTVDVLPLDQDLLAALEAGPYPTDRTFHCGVVTLVIHL